MRKFALLLAVAVLCPILLAQQALNNDGVIKLVKAGLSESLIIDTINASPASYDTTANGLVALKTAGVSDKVIAAIVMKAAGVAAPPVASASSNNGLPSGIDEVGVYYRNKSGAWTPLLPEIVNFKTGGFLKSLATDGLVKGDINGHIQGQHAKLSLTFPVVLAVYMPEDRDITEYQLLHLRTNSDSREFRSMTGGVIHASGGAKRDKVDFQPVKIAPRVYQLTLESSLGKGEFGLLPPGSYSSSNMASGGKIYSISVIE